jgi:hypothetical protein
MSIEVQCPNPDCAKVYKAKDKYAGLQCYCPDCRAIMDVPPLAGGGPAQAFESLAADELLAEGPALEAEAAPAAAADAVGLENEPAAEAEADVLEAEVEEEATEPTPPPKPRRSK